jgi:hypothetical protein
MSVEALSGAPVGPSLRPPASRPPELGPPAGGGRKIEPLAICSLTMGLLWCVIVGSAFAFPHLIGSGWRVLLSPFCFSLAVGAIVTGFLANSDIAKSGGIRTGRVAASIGTRIGIAAATAAVIVVTVFAALVFAFIYDLSRLR